MGKKINTLIIYIIVLVAFSSCKKPQSKSVKELHEQYTIEELEELYKIKIDTVQRVTFNKQLEEESMSIEVDSILKAMFVIYGPDDRIDLYDENVPERISNSSGVIALVLKDSLVDNGDGNFSLKTNSLENEKKVCSSERFSKQPVGAFCTGFVVAQNVIVTAGHCIRGDSDLEKTRFLLGFSANSADDFNTDFNINMILTGKKIISRGNSNGLDYAVIEINEFIPENRILSVNSNTKTADNDSLYVIGFPSGLPMKIAGGANVRENNDAKYFIANLDSYGGNSGSPVFNSITHEVEGILVSGEIDYVPNGNCNISNTCPDTGCKGEVISRVSQFASYLNVASIQ